MEKGKNRLQMLKEKLLPQNAGMGMLTNAMKMMLPQLGETLDKMQLPEGEGGLLKEGEHKIVFLIVQTGNGTLLTINALKKTDAGMLITRTVSDQPLEKIFEDGINDQA